jgi:hypothetical protein
VLTRTSRCNARGVQFQRTLTTLLTIFILAWACRRRSPCPGQDWNRYVTRPSVEPRVQISVIGKTMAFLLPAIEQLAKKPVPPGGTVSILVLSPTRELAMQVCIEPASNLQMLTLMSSDSKGGRYPCEKPSFPGASSHRWYQVPCCVHAL